MYSAEIASITTLKGHDIHTIQCGRCYTGLGNTGSNTDCSWLQLQKVTVLSSTSDLSLSSHSLISTNILFVQNQLACTILRMIEEMHCFNFIIRSNKTDMIKLQTLGALSLAHISTGHTTLTQTLSGVTDEDLSQKKPLIILKVFFANITSNGGQLLENNNEIINMSLEEYQLLHLSLFDNHLTLPPSLRLSKNRKISYLKVTSCRKLDC